MRRLVIGAWVVGFGFGPSACVEDPTEVSLSGQDGTDGESSADGASPLCGNLQIDPEEDCDNGGDPLDGCTNDCRFGPIGFLMGMHLDSPMRGNTMSPIQIFTDMCPLGQVLIGLKGRVGQSETIRRLGGLCGTLNVKFESGAYIVDIARGESLNIYGNDYDDNTEIYCSPNQTLVAFDGSVDQDDDERLALSQLRMTCAPIEIIDDGETFSLEMGEPSISDPFGPGSQSVFMPSECGEGMVSTVTNIKADNGIRAFGIGCGPLTLQVAGP